MLDALRSKSGGWVAKIFIGILALSFAVWGIADVFSGRPTDTLAEVGTRQVSVQEFNDRFDRQLRSFSRQFGRQLTREQAREFGLDRQVLGQLLQDAAVEAQADALKLQISSNTVAQQVANNPNYQDRNGQFDAAQFQRLLRTAGYTEQAFIFSERQGLIRAAIASTVERGVEVPRNLAELAYKYRNEQRDVRYFVVTVDESTIPEPSDSELKTFYDDNPHLFQVPQRRVIAALQVTPNTLGDRIQIPEEDIKEYYERRKDEFGTPETRTIERIAFDSEADAAAAHTKIEAGMSFDDLAKERGVVGNDLLLGTFTRKMLPDQSLVEAAFSLDKGAVSKPVKGKLSTMLLRVTDIVPGSQKSLDEARDEIKAALRADLARDEILNVYERVEEMRASGQSFDEIGNSIGIKVVVTPPVDRTGKAADGKPVDSIEDASEIIAAAFQCYSGIDNDPFTSRSDGYIWFEVRDIEPESVKPLDEVREEAIREWKNRQLRIAVIEKAEALQKRAENGESLAKLAEELNADLKSQQGVKRNEASEEFDATAVAALFSAKEDGFAVAPQGDGKGALVMQSSPVLARPYSVADEDAKALSRELSVMLANDLYAQYLADLQRRLGVNINENVLANAGSTAYRR